MHREDSPVNRIDWPQFARLIEARRSYLGATVRDAAREIGVSSATISRAQRGMACDANSFVAICAWIGVDMRVVLRVPQGDADA